MTDLLWYQYLLIGLIFAWSGFVRTSLGFGGAVLALPFLLLVVNEPLVFLPIVAIHLLIFSSWIAWNGHRQVQKAGVGGTSPESNIDWGYLTKALKIMIVPKLIGVVGLLTLPSQIMTNIIFGIVIIYAIGYVLNKPFRSNNKYVDIVLLCSRWLCQWHLVDWRAADCRGIRHPRRQRATARHHVCAVVYPGDDQNGVVYHRRRRPPTDSSTMATALRIYRPFARRKSPPLHAKSRHRAVLPRTGSRADLG